MGKKGKRFIDKRQDVIHSFKVVARSQQDPLVADPQAPQAVLQPKQDTGSQKCDQEEYGIFFDDDYNYLQHLRGVREAVNWNDEDLEVYMIRREDTQIGKKELRGKKLILPSSAFESFVEEPIGMLNKAAPITGPRPELDPDVVAGLDDNDDEIFNDNYACLPEDEDALPDNFVAMLNAEAPLHDLNDDDGEWVNCQDEHEASTLEDISGDNVQNFLPFTKLGAYREKPQYDDCYIDEEEKDISSDFNDSDYDDEARDQLDSLDNPSHQGSHFTSYSLTSSVLPRKDHLSTLDDCFEEKFVREYMEEQVGALDGEDIEGFIGEESPLFRQALEHSSQQLKDEMQHDRARIISWIKDMQQCTANKDELEVMDETKKERWDCESILSLNSTLYNHPRTITVPPRTKRIIINPTTGLPIEHKGASLLKHNLTTHQKAMADAQSGVEADTQTLITSMSAISIRLPGETSEERRSRKKAIKELRRERRIEKKANRAAFKEEKRQQEKIMMNNRYNKISLV